MEACEEVKTSIHPTWRKIFSLIDENMENMDVHSYHPPGGVLEAGEDERSPG